MKKQVSALLASMLLVGGLMLPACGGSAQNSSSETEAAVEEVKEDPAKKFLGEWKMAAAESNGVTMVGDLSLVLGTDDGFTFNLSEDGTGSFAFSDEKANVTWKLETDDSISIQVESEDEDKDEDSSTPTNLTANYKDGEISIEMDELGGTMVFTPTGKSDNYFEIALDNATAITSEDELVGSWKLQGMNLMGISVYGSSKDLSSFSGQELNADITFEKGGKGTFAGDEITWEVSTEGAFITVDGIDYKLQVKKLDDARIVLDMSDFVSIDMSLMYEK